MFEVPTDVLEWMDQVTADNKANGFDATDWLYQTWAYQAHDVGTTPGQPPTPQARSPASRHAR